VFSTGVRFRVTQVSHTLLGASPARRGADDMLFWPSGGCGLHFWITIGSIRDDTGPGAAIPVDARRLVLSTRYEGVRIPGIVVCDRLAAMRSAEVFWADASSSLARMERDPYHAGYRCRHL